jgi:hypothetical protein
MDRKKSYTFDRITGFTRKVLKAKSALTRCYSVILPKAFPACPVRIKMKDI